MFELFISYASLGKDANTFTMQGLYQYMNESGHLDIMLISIPTHLHFSLF